MAKYQLTGKQKDILRAASNGLRDGTVQETWSWFTMPSDQGGLALSLTGLPDAENLGVTTNVLRVFVELGFLIELSNNGGSGAYDVHEQAIHDAVDNDFEDPSTVSQVAPPTVVIEQGAGSYLNISVNSQHVTQTINASTSLPDHAKVKLEKEAEVLYEILEETQTAYLQESRTLEKHLRRLVEDVSEPEPDKQDVIDLLARLTKAGVAFAAIAQVASSIETIGEIIMQLPFMQ
jgi:hypothetical protein